MIMMHTQFGSPYAAQMLVSSTATTPCCDGTRTITGPDGTPRPTVCSCQYDGRGMLLRPPLAGFPIYSTAYPDHGYPVSLTGADTAALYAPGTSPYDLKDGNPSLAQPTACYPYGAAVLAGPPPQYPFHDGYPGMDFPGVARRKNATRETTSALKAWLHEHRKNPYPTKGEKIMLAIITKMTLTQVSTWFANARRRLKKENKMTWSPRNRTDDENKDSPGENADQRNDGDKDRMEITTDTELDDIKVSDDERDLEIDCDSRINVTSPDSLADDREFPKPSLKSPLRLTTHDNEHESRPSTPNKPGTTECRAAKSLKLDDAPSSKNGPLLIAAPSVARHSADMQSSTSRNQETQPAKPRIWSLADTATSTDEPKPVRSVAYSLWTPQNADYGFHHSSFNGLSRWPTNGLLQPSPVALSSSLSAHTSPSSAAVAAAPGQPHLANTVPIIYQRSPFLSVSLKDNIHSALDKGTNVVSP